MTMLTVGVVFFISQRGINIGIDPSLANYLISILVRRVRHDW